MAARRLCKLPQVRDRQSQTQNHSDALCAAAARFSRNKAGTGVSEDRLAQSCRRAALKLKTNIAQPPTQLAQHALLVRLILRHERDAETKIRARVIPRHSRNQLLGNQPLRNLFGSFE